MRRLLTVAPLAILPAALAAQRPPAIRTIGKIERVSTDSLASVSAALPMSNGRVLVNDMTGRRLVMFDSALTKLVVVADTTSGTANAYGTRAASVIRYRGDSALFMDQTSLSMLVIGPTGTIARVMAIPRPDDAQRLIGGSFGTPGFDAQGRLVYRGPGGGFRGVLMLCCVGTARPPIPGMPRDGKQLPDSAYLIRVDLAARSVDTATAYKIAKMTVMPNVDGQGFIQSIAQSHEPVSMIDEWAVMPDGAIAVVRGHDYHIDWLDRAGTWTSSPKMAFDWHGIDDERKRTIIDSTMKADQALLDEIYGGQVAQRAQGGGGGGGGGGAGRGGRGGGGGGGGGRGSTPAATGQARGPIPLVAGALTLADVPDYVPPFEGGALYPDADGNLWIRTTTMEKGQPVYDIVNRRGELVDRAVLPPFRTIAGFAPGVVFMSVKDAAGIVHLERARVK